ncbi:hypothetical protein PGB90_000820 [Kerria lacca]
MRHYVKGKDFRRIGGFFQDDTLEESTQENMTAAKNWKSVMTELHEKKIKTKELQSNIKSRKNIDSSFDSGIQQEYNSDNDEVCNSICMTLNRLVELSKEQQLYVNYSESLNDIAEIDNAHNDLVKTLVHPSYHLTEKPNSKNNECFSTRNFNNETNNLVEEVFMKNSCSVENISNENLEKTIFGNITSRNFSNSAHNLDTLSLDSSKETSLQSLPMRKPLINYTTKINTAASSKYIFDIVVAIDIGTSFSGFTYCIDNFTKGNTRIVIKVEDRRIKKIPSILLLNSKTEFHSFGHDAKNYFLTIEKNTNTLSSHWLLFEKFKLQLLNISEINRESKIKALNGIYIPALTVYTHTLSYFKDRAIKEISDTLQQPVKKNQIQWIVTIPIMWSVKGKLFIQEAAFNAGLCTTETCNKLTVMYESEAIATLCNIFNWNCFTQDMSIQHLNSYYFLVINCGGGIVEITVHRSYNKYNCVISEVHKSSEIIYSSYSIREEFIQLLISVFGSKFINLLQVEKPASFIELLHEFENCCYSLFNITSHRSIEIIFKKYICEFYQKITGMQYIEKILQNRTVEKKISRIYFTGGLIKSEIFQNEMKKLFENKHEIIFIQDVGEAELCVMNGALQKFGNKSLKYSKITHSYAIGVIKEFQKDVHSIEKLVLKDGRRWCCDLLDWIVRKNQILQEGEVILKRYMPTTSHQSCIIINIYAVEHENSKYVTDQGVHSCGVLRLSTSPSDKVILREILLQFIFAGNEFFVNALDTLTGHCNQIQLDNLSYL